LVKIKDCSEEELVRRLHDMLGTSMPQQGSEGKVVCGVGDDAAVMETGPDRYLVSSCDMMIEGRHFDLSYTHPRDLGYKALAINLSDMAAMGATARWAMVSLAIPAETTLHFWEDFYRGMLELAREAGVAVVGGDTTSSSTIVVDVFVMGEVFPQQLICRFSASKGDCILVTGELGSSAAGLYWFQEASMRGIMEKSRANPLIQAHLRPVPRYREAAVLRNSRVGAMIDLSDGLAAGLRGICAASNTGARVDYNLLPYRPEAELLAEKAGHSLQDWLLYGGEDYELLFTVPQQYVDSLKQSLEVETGTPAVVIGEVTGPEKGMILINKSGAESVIDPGRCYRHFT